MKRKPLEDTENDERWPRHNHVLTDSPFQVRSAAAPTDERSQFSLLHFLHWSQHTEHKKSHKYKLNK